LRSFLHKKVFTAKYIPVFLQMSKIIGSRAQVWHGTATHTSGGLTKTDLMQNKHGRIVSKRRHAAGQNAIKHLEKSGHKGKLPGKRGRGGNMAVLDSTKGLVGEQDSTSDY
jgi:hypothetical protein